jgi:outer membrane immunogenic protein
MKKQLFASSALVLILGFGSGARAADLPARKAPPPPPVAAPLWTGFYSGLNAGYSFGTNNSIYSAATPIDPQTIYAGPGVRPRAQAQQWSENGPGGGASLINAMALAQTGVFQNTQSGFVGGGQIGYNIQYNSFVFGFETDIQGAGIRGTSSGTGVGSASANFGPNGHLQALSNAVGLTTAHTGVDWIGTVRGRVGYLVTPTMLAYGTAGFTYGGAYAHITTSAIDSQSFTWNGLHGSHALGGFNRTYIGGGSQNKILTGWNAGGGVEWMFMPNWSLKAEGIYWNMGNMSVPTYSFATAPVSGGNCSGIHAAQCQGGVTVGRATVNYQGVIARMGLNYHFSLGGLPLFGR